jgi:hypothetical protein
MSIMSRSLSRLLPALLLCLAFKTPLQAQLDPRLQGTKTDFLDLFQQSNSKKVKPEIVTVFDFSGSMMAMMCHPKYYSTDLDDSGSYSTVSFTLSGSAGSRKVSASVSGSSVTGITSLGLVRPDGSLVTETNVNTTLAGTLPGQSEATKAADVRNWIRAASHVRIKATVSGQVRTIDLPIPWKIMDGNSTGYPLSSKTVLDRYTVINADGTTTDYGTGQQIEVDTRYKIQTGFGTDASACMMIYSTSPTNQASTSTVSRFNVRLKKAYVDWLFNGTYQNTNSTRPDYTTDAALVGKFIVFDAALMTNVGLQTRLDQGQGFGTFLTGEDTLRTNAIPAYQRVQGVKEAAIRTWIEYQTRVFWAYRFLDHSGEASNGSATTINNDSRTTVNAADPTANYIVGKDNGWVLMNSNSLVGMQRIAALFPYTNTPLCYATARSLAQFSDPNSIFEDVETGDDEPVSCQRRFLIVFTDGVPTSDNSSESHADTPYITTSGGNTGNAQEGNTRLIASKTSVNCGSTWWNLFTFAGAAAHLADDSKTGYASDLPITTYMDIPTAGYPSSGSPSSYLPFAIPSRGSLTLQRTYRLVTTMTVGVSLAGSYNDAASPKRRLFLAAAVGDPSRTSWDLSVLTPYTVDETDPDHPKTKDSVYFFDATDPDTLITNLGYAFRDSAGDENLNVTANPNLPYIGASLGKQIYLGKFTPPEGGGVLWSGDLLMFPTKVDSDSKTVILNNTGNPATVLDSSTAGWSAADALLNNRRWESRKLYTRRPSETLGVEPGLGSFTYTGTAYTDTSTGLQKYVANNNTASYPAGSAAQQRLIQHVMGASSTTPSSSVPAEANRADIMGDIINSSPSYLEYQWSEVKSRLTSKLNSGRSRFRLILVGDNQGWLHGFGETTSITSIAPDSSKPSEKVDLVSGEVDELWSFLPTEFLANLDYLESTTSPHRFMVDGSPMIYFLDLPASTGGSGNGVFDGSNDTISPLTDTTHERAIAIVGLRKGGRGYYALNLHDPFNPTLQWALVPDEADKIASTRNKTGLSDSTLKNIIANMGYSTSTPSIGRILFNGIYKDAVFLGGGYSVPEIEANFTGTPKLGRSVIALDVHTGDILAAVDLTAASIGGSNIGPISAGVVPFEFFLGSGMAQRAYFLDMWGGLWCWGSKGVVNDAASPFNKFRKDTSELQSWSSDGSKSSPYGGTGIRKVYQDANSTGSSGKLVGPAYTTLPAPFLVRTFPGKGHSSGTATPTVVGIAMVSGDRNDPLDYGTNLPANTRLTVVFDRQDSRSWGLDNSGGSDPGINSDTQLLNAGKWGVDGAISSTLSYGDQSISSGSTSYYLAPTSSSSTKFGYYVTFPDRQNDGSLYHYSKGINPPIVVAGSLYYAYFTPNKADVCTGGSGITYSNLICDVMNPIASDARTGIRCISGLVDRWLNVASDFSAMGTVGVQQAGTRATADPNDSSNTISTMDTATYLGQAHLRYPKALVWRTVQ